MAKKKTKSKSKTTKKTERKKTVDHKTPEEFWAQAASFVLAFVIAPFTLLGLFNVGGSLPISLGDFFEWLVGFGAFAVPFIMFLIGFRVLKHEGSRLKLSVYFAMFFFVAALGGIDKVLSSDNAEGGGAVGGGLGELLESLTTNWLALLMLFVGGIVSAFYVFGIPLRKLLDIKSLFAVDSEKMTLAQQSSETAGLKEAPADKKEQKKEKKEFKLNEGVPMQKSRSTLKNTAKPISDNEDHVALTAADDPDWDFPSTDLLSSKQDKADAGDVKGNADIIQQTLSDFKIDVEMESANVGPRVTQFTLKPPSGVRLTKITSLENNIALNLAANSIRIEAPIPGKRAVGIEVPNKKSATVRLRDVLQSKEWKSSKGSLTFAIGRDISGDPIVADLAKMPHLLVAGQTGSGKSVMVNTFLSSLLYRNSPSNLKLILVDPKQVELTPYNDMPHLLTPVIVEPEKCISALKWAVAEMERRLSSFAEVSKRNISEYNNATEGEQMPYIVIVIDELADLMMMAARDVEGLIVRLAQKARATGIHLVLATQRPSVDVITGLIKANIPARIAFTVASQIDSRTIIDQGGAEKLLGQGDMLLHTSQLPKPKRIQGVFIDEKEVSAVTDHIRMQRPPEYDSEVVSQPVQLDGKGGIVAPIGDDEDDLFRDAVQVVLDSGKASASLLQRRLRVGYARAARLIESMEDKGIVGPADGARPREVLISSIDDLSSGEDEEEI